MPEKSLVDDRIGAARLQSGEIVFETRNRAGRFGVALHRCCVFFLTGLQVRHRVSNGFLAGLRLLFDELEAFVDLPLNGFLAGLRLLFDDAKALVDLPFNRSLAGLCLLFYAANAFADLPLDGFEVRLRLLLDGASKLVDLRDALFENLVRRFRFSTDLAKTAGDRFKIAGECGNLRSGLIGGRGNLIGESRKALMQALHGVLQTFIGAHPFDTVDTVGKTDDAGAELIERLRLFARGDIDLARGLRHGAIVFGLAAFGRFEAARNAAQLFFDAPEYFAAFVFAARHMGEHIFGVAARRPRFRRYVETADIRGPRLAHGRVVVRIVREAAQDTACHPFADGQALPACRCSRSFASLRRDTRHIPRDVWPHFNSLSTTPATESTDDKM